MDELTSTTSPEMQPDSKGVQNDVLDVEGTCKGSYGENFKEHLLEEYKMYVEMADRVSERRTKANAFYTSLLSAILAILPIVGNRMVYSGSLSVPLLIISLLGISLCFLWNLNVNSYKQLNSLKFKVIHEMEMLLPFPCYTREWQILKEETKKQNYLRLTAVEKYVPIFFSIPYFVLFAYSLAELLSIVK